jgi:hypothetical protein
MKKWLVANRVKLISLIVLIALVAISHPAPFFQGSVYLSGDARNSDAFTAAGENVLNQGEYPQWNPYLFGGMPTFGSMVYNRFVYFPSELFNFLQSRLHFAPLTWMMAHLLFGGIGIMFLLRRWSLPLYAQLFGATVWMLFPKIVAWGVHGHGSKLGAAMFIPWIVAFTLDLLDGKGKRKAGLLALFIGMQFLRGHVQISYYTLLTIGVLLLGNLVSTFKTKQWKDKLPGTGYLLLAIIAGMLIGAVLLWPTLQYADISIRGGDSGGATYDFATGWSLSPGELGTFIFPSIAGFGKLAYQGGMPFNDYPNYFGVLTFLLVFVAILHRREKYSWSFMAIALLAVLVSFGKFFPLFYNLLFNYLPFFNKFRVPSMVLILTGFSVSILSAIGIAKVSEQKFKLKIPGVVLTFMGFLLIVLSADSFQTMFASTYNSVAESCGRNTPPAMLSSIAWETHSEDLLRIGLLLLLSGVLLLFSNINSKFRITYLPWIMLLFIVIDYSGVNRLIRSPQHGLFNYSSNRLIKAGSPITKFSENNLEATPEYIKMTDTIGHQRLWPLGNLSVSNEPMFASIRSLGGYHPAKTASFEMIRDMLNDPSLPAGRVASWMAGEYLLIDQRLPIEFINAFASLGVDLNPTPTVYKSMYLYKNSNALSRARLVGDWEQADSNATEFLENLQAGKISTDVVRLDKTPAVLPKKSVNKSDPVEYVHDGSNSVILKTNSENSAILVLADIWSPGWSVIVDGQKAQLLKADYLLRAVALTAGTHDVEFRYNDPSLRQGVIISIIGLLIAIVLMVLPKTGRQIPDGE